MLMLTQLVRGTAENAVQAVGLQSPNSFYFALEHDHAQGEAGKRQRPQCPPDALPRNRREERMSSKLMGDC